MMVPILRETIAAKIPEEFSPGTGRGLLTGTLAMSVMFTTVAISGITTAVGAILLYYSQRMRLRLLDKKDKESI